MNQLAGLKSELESTAISRSMKGVLRHVLRRDTRPIAVVYVVVGVVNNR